MTTDETLDLKFHVGDRVVHPQQGVGFVADLEEKQFEPNRPRLYYVIQIPDTTVWVPVDLSTTGLRKLSVKSELEHCREVLQATPQMLTADRGLLSSLIGHINQGTVTAHCEVVRDLNAFGWRKPLYGPMAEFQRVIQNVLNQEWAVVGDMSVVEASHEITGLLKKGRAAHEN